MRAMILRRSEGTIGEVAALLAAATEAVLSEGQERIDATSVETAEYQPPTRAPAPVRAPVAMSSIFIEPCRSPLALASAAVRLGGPGDMGAPDRRGVRRQLRRVPPQCPGPHGRWRARSGPSACPCARQTIRWHRRSDRAITAHDHSAGLGPHGAMDGGGTRNTSRPCCARLPPCHGVSPWASHVGGTWILIVDCNYVTYS